MPKRLLVLALLSQLITGPAFAKDAVPIAICDTDRKSMGEPCQAYIGSNYREARTQKWVKQACDNAKSKWVLHTACPAQGRVGVCTMDAGKPAEFQDVYYAQAREAARACTTVLQGKWSPK